MKGWDTIQPCDVRLESEKIVAAFETGGQAGQGVQRQREGWRMRMLRPP